MSQNRSMAIFRHIAIKTFHAFQAITCPTFVLYIYTYIVFISYTYYTYICLPHRPFDAKQKIHSILYILWTFLMINMLHQLIHKQVHRNLLHLIYFYFLQKIFFGNFAWKVFKTIEILLLLSDHSRKFHSHLFNFIYFVYVFARG